MIKRVPILWNIIWKASWNRQMTKVHLTRETQCLRLTVNSNDRLWVANNLYARVLHSRYWGRNIEEVLRPNKVPFLESQFMLAASCSRKEDCGHFDFRANRSRIARVPPQSWSENVERFRLHSAGSVSIFFFRGCGLAPQGVANWNVIAR